MRSDSRVLVTQQLEDTPFYQRAMLQSNLLGESGQGSAAYSSGNARFNESATLNHERKLQKVVGIKITHEALKG